MSGATDREREQRSVEAIRHLSFELAELIDLRGRISVARTILARGGGRQDAIDVLDGTPPTPKAGG